MKLYEILNIEHLPYEWLTPTTGKFILNETVFGIVLEEMTLRLPSRDLSVVNITFGPVVDMSKPISERNIDRNLTNFGKPRTVMSTVANACVNNPQLKQNDIIIVAASDQVKEKRIGIYTLAISELATRLAEYKYSYRATTREKSILVVDSKVELTDDEVQFVATKVLEKDI